MNRTFSNVGKRLLPTTIDEIAKEDPNRVALSIPRSSDLAGNFEDVTFLRLSNAINRMSWFIETLMGRSETFETFACIGRSDMRYIIIAVAAAKTGWKALLLSHMNSLAGHLNLLQHCSCSILMSANGVKVADILKERPMQNIIVPLLDELLNPAPVPQYDFRKTWEEAKLDPYLVLHTSGSTGLPKPITLNHSIPAVIDAHSRVDILPSETPDYKRVHRVGYFKGRVIVPFAPFHIIVCNLMLALVVYGETILVLPSRDGSAGPNDILKAIDYMKPESAFLPPSTISELAESDEGLERLSRLKYVFYGGGVLPQNAGQLVSSRTRLINQWGSTENGAPILGEQGPGEWEYLTFDPDYNGFEWRAVSWNEGDGTAKSTEFYEPVIVKKPELEPYQQTFLLYPELEEWPIGDLYTKHPIKPHTWKFAGRTDDLICFSHGVKYHPLGTEEQVSGHPHVQSALMFGDGHLQSVLLLELRKESSNIYYTGRERDHKEIEASIWKLVDEINGDAPTVAYIARTHMVFAIPSKPFWRASKGTVQRKLTIGLYRDKIEACYKTFGDNGFSMLGRLEQQH